MRRMSAPELAAHLENASPLLLDVREPWEFEICHIDGSINMPMGQIPQNMARFNELINLEGGVEAWARQVDADMPVY